MKLAPRIDWLLFTKRGYSLLTHLIPFTIASLLLVVVSVPKDNLLIQLADRLQQPSWLWLPAAVLTLATGATYMATTSVQIRRAYLFKAGRWRRTIITASLYLTVCTAMAYGVLRSAAPASPYPGTIWACLLLALLSLTGIGWSEKSSWVESMGIQCPDYTKSDQAVLGVTNLLSQTRKAATGTKQNIDDFLKGVDKLQTEIEDNLQYEPTWERAKLLPIVEKLKTLTNAVESAFPDSKPNAIADFAVASRCEKAPQYSAFIDALNDVGQYWGAWKCS